MTFDLLGTAEETQRFYGNPDHWPRLNNITALSYKNGPSRESAAQREFRPFEMVSDFAPAGDQPQAIKELTQGLMEGKKDQVLLGVTGSGKTFTMAHVIANMNRPSVIMAHNKTLAAQLYGEFRAFFPNNAVEYFVSYYDYYTPESYVARTDTYIAKESSINEDIDRMRHAATRALFERNDCIIVASVSCIYGIGSPETYAGMVLDLIKDQEMPMSQLFEGLARLQYIRNDMNFVRGTFRVKGDIVDIFPVHNEDRAWRLSFFGDTLESIFEIDALTAAKTSKEPLSRIRVYPKSHYVTPGPTIRQAVEDIKRDLQERLVYLRAHEKLLEAARLEQRTQYDIETLITTNTCQGIENYSRYLTGRNRGEPPPTLFEYLPSDALLFVDESHVSLPQIRAMFKGDYSRKTNLSTHGFRLPSCMDNRPMRFEEWDEVRPKTVYVSATPGSLELEKTKGVFIEQVIRPTGLIDPPVMIKPATHQVEDVIAECRETIARGFRVLVTTLTKAMAEKLSEFFFEQNINAKYMHADVETLDRIALLQDLRAGGFDVLIGINLLREGLDIPECALVAILDADKEGFLRSETSLLQTIGRAARNADAKVILYADKETGSMQRALAETNRRRQKQKEYNLAHGITPKTVYKSLERLSHMLPNTSKESAATPTKNALTVKESLEKMDEKALLLLMRQAAKDLDFEKAAKIRDLIKAREKPKKEV